MTTSSQALWLIWTLVLGPWAFLFAQQPARDVQPTRNPNGTAVISGVVQTDETPSEPVRQARVMLNPVDGGIPGRTVTTDEGGRFSFSELPDGRYTLQAAKPAYIRANYGAKRPGRPGTPISLAAGQKITDLVLRISRGGVITGTLRDQSGQPSPGVTVHVMRYDYSPTSGVRMLSSESLSTTDDRGVYRAWGLPPGEYVVVATPGPDQRMPPGARVGSGLEEIRRLSPAEVQSALALLQAGRAGGGGAPAAVRNEPNVLPPSRPVNYAPVFHPATTNLAHAASINLGLAEERNGVDVQIQLVPTATLAGSCVLPPGVQAQTISVTLTFTGSPVEVRQGFGLPATRSARLNPAAQFSFVGITPGRYTISAKTELPASRGAEPGRAAGPPVREASSAPSWWARAEIDIDGQDLSVPLELQPSMSVVGRMVFEGAALPPEDVTGIQFRLLPRGAAGNLGASPPGGQVDQQGTFRFSDVTPDSYRLMAFGSGAARMGGWSRKSADVLGVDLFDAPLDVKPGMGTIALTIRYTDRPTEISGMLQDATGRPAPDYFIVVFSTNRTLWGPQTRRVQTTRPATDGAYTFELPAGEYFIAALTDFAPGDSNDPAFLEQLIPGAIKITVADGEKKRQDFRITGR